MPKSRLRPKVGAKHPAVHVPSAAQRTLVELAAAMDMTIEQTAKAVGINPETLKRHYATEMETGRQKLLLKIGATMASMATNPNHKQAFLAGKLWLEAKGGFKTPAAPVHVEATATTSAPEAGKDGEITFSISIGDAKPVDG